MDRSGRLDRSQTVPKTTSTGDQNACVTSFGGDKKKGSSILGPVERRFIDWAVPRLPSWLLSHHLTMVTRSGSGTSP